jgi:ribosomal protein S11
VILFHGLQQEAQDLKDRKVRLFALKRLLKTALEALSTGMKNVEILKGQGSGRETAIRAIEGGV